MAPTTSEHRRPQETSQERKADTFRRNSIICTVSSNMKNAETGMQITPPLKNFHLKRSPFILLGVNIFQLWEFIKDEHQVHQAIQNMYIKSRENAKEPNKTVKLIIRQ